MLYSVNAGEVPIPHGNMPGKKCYDYLLLKSVWRYKNISKAATSTHSTSHLLEGKFLINLNWTSNWTIDFVVCAEPSLSHTKRSSEEVEEETKHQGSKVSNASPFRHMQSLVTAHQDVTCASCTLTTQALSQSTGEGSGPPREPDIAKVKGECRMNSAFNAALRIPVSSERKQVYHINTLNSS